MFKSARQSLVRWLTATRFIALFGTLPGLLYACLAVAVGPSVASAQDAPPEADPFSILAPVPETPEEPEQSEEVVPHPPAAGHLDRNAYLARAPERSPDVLRTTWQVQRTSLDGMRLSSEQRILVLGDGYVMASESGQIVIHDFRLNRILSSVGSLAGPVMRNTSMTARVHRKMDTFTAYTQGGTLDRVPGPGGTSFDRFWIEAAMGVRLNRVPMFTSTRPDGSIEAQRNSLENAAFSYLPDAVGSASDADLLLRWMRHTLPIHPDSLDIMLTAEGVPARFTFLVFSPSSPEGRREIWTRISAQADEAEFPWPEEIHPAPAASYEMRNTDYLPLITAGMRAVSVPEDAPSSDSFISTADAANNRADRAGAYLTLYHASNHFGACEGADVSQVCQRIAQSAAGSEEDPQFEAILAMLAAMGNDRAIALDGLQQHLHRDSFAGAAANLMAAQALATLQTSGEGADYETTPVRLFAESAGKDPYAPLIYWHAGRYAASQGDIEIAWLLFDIARSLPTSTLLTAIFEADAITGQLRAIAPNFFAP